MGGVYGTRGKLIAGAFAGGLQPSVYNPAVSATGSVSEGFNLVANSTAVAAASYTLPAPVAGLQVEVFVSSYSTAGTDSVVLLAPSGVKISDGTTPTEDTVTFGAAGQHIRLVGTSATLYVVAGTSTGVTLST